MARKYTRMRITHINIYRLSLFMSGAKILLWCARALSLAHSGFSRSLSHSLGLTPRFIPRSLTRSLPPTLVHWFPYSGLFGLVWEHAKTMCMCIPPSKTQRDTNPAPHSVRTSALVVKTCGRPAVLILGRRESSGN